MALPVDPDTIQTPTTGDEADPAWGQAVRDYLIFLSTDAPACKVWRSTNQSVTSGVTPKIVTFDTERKDNAGLFPGSGSKITIPSGMGSNYSMACGGVFTTNTSGSRQFGIRKNGTLYLARITVPAGAGGFGSHAFVYVEADLAAGDYIEMTVAQDSGGSLDLLTDSTTDDSPWLALHWIGL